MKIRIEAEECKVVEAAGEYTAVESAASALRRLI
jgi:hypothetical protein